MDLTSPSRSGRCRDPPALQQHHTATQSSTLSTAMKSIHRLCCSTGMYPTMMTTTATKTTTSDKCMQASYRRLATTTTPSRSVSLSIHTRTHSPSQVTLRLPRSSSSTSIASLHSVAQIHTSTATARSMRSPISMSTVSINAALHSPNVPPVPVVSALNSHFLSVVCPNPPEKVKYNHQCSPSMDNGCSLHLHSVSMSTSTPQRPPRIYPSLPTIPIPNGHALPLLFPTLPAPIPLPLEIDSPIDIHSGWHRVRLCSCVARRLGSCL